MKKSINITDFKEANEIRSIVDHIGNLPLKEGSHGFLDVGSIKIIDAAKSSTANYSERSKTRPAISIIDVVLAAHRNYNKVVAPNIKRIEKTDLNSIEDLKNLISSKSKVEFYEFWGHKDNKKYNTLKSILESTDEIKTLYRNSNSDFEYFNQWANNVDINNYKLDPIGKIPNIGVATIQHLRMAFGAKTIKPDQRVKEVLEFEFGLDKLNDIKVINVMEQIAKIVNLDVLTIDQIFVKYGSGYYNKTNSKLNTKEIAKRLKDLGISVDIISKATDLSITQINKI
jgi:hypothetical protein